MRISEDIPLGDSPGSKRRMLMKLVISALLIVSMLTACGSQSGPTVQPPIQPTTQGASKIVQTNNGAQIFIGGKLVDVITIGSDGSATHNIAGRTVVDRLKLTSGIVPLAHGGNDCFEDKANMGVANQ